MNRRIESHSEPLYTVEVPAERLRYWGTAKKQYVVEPGESEFLVGAAPDDIRLKLPMTIAN